MREEEEEEQYEDNQKRGDEEGEGRWENEFKCVCEYGRNRLIQLA